jgi:uncharacterized protein YhaN
VRILSLDLIAYGLFSGKTMEFPPDKGLFVVYGPNEAGKSTCLRAVRGLLFGIPERTADAYLYGASKLRVGATLRRSDGKRLEIARRKGRKDTLLDPDMKPIPEPLLREFMGGIDEDTFLHVFGMNRDELVKGGAALVEGKGAVGESLFAAGLGGADLKGFLESLEDDAASLFKPAGSTPPINAQMRQFNEKKAAVRDSSLKRRDWEEAEREVSDLEGKTRELREKVESLRSSSERLGKLRDAIPAATELLLLRKRREELGEVRILRKDFPIDRTGTQKTIAQESARLATARGKAVQEDEAVKSISIPEALLAQEPTIKQMRDDLGAALQARKDMPKVAGAVAEARRSAAAILAELRPDLPLESAESLRITVALRETLRELVAKHQSLEHRIQTASEREAESAATLMECEEELSRTPVVRDVADLEGAVALVRKKGDLEGEHAGILVGATGARRDAEIALSGLAPFWSGELMTAESLPVPGMETIGEFDEGFGKLDRLIEKALEDKGQAAGRIAEIGAGLEKLRLSGEPPTEEDLAAARDRRRQGWTLVRTRLKGEDADEAAERAYDPASPLEEAYEKSVDSADLVADRMRHEATAVASKASLLAEKELVHKRTLELEREIGDLGAQREALLRKWAERWSPAGIAPGSPREMREWVLKWHDLSRRAAEIRKLEAQAGASRAQIESSKALLSRQVAAAGETAPPSQASLEEHLLVADRIISAQKGLAGTRADLEKDRAAAARGSARAGEEKRKAEGALVKWRVDWEKAVREVSEGLTPGATSAFLDRCSDLSVFLEQAAKDQSRVAGMNRLIETFGAEAAEFVGRFAPELSGLPWEQAVRELSDRVQKAKEDAVALREAKKRHADAKSEIEEADREMKAATLRLAELRREAGCETDEELPGAEARSEEARELGSKAGELERRLALLAAGSGKTIEEFVDEASSSDPGAVQAQIDDVAVEYGAAQETSSAEAEGLGAARERFKAMDGRATAALAAQEAQQILAALRGRVDRYLRLRLAAKVLRAEIERYRERSQGPVLRRASELFASVTDGRFVGLAPDYDAGDTPVLVGLRPEGEKVLVQGMSDGTQDQLYLALRLASLEKFVGEGEPLPLLVDDALVNFDDDRAKAALRIMAELAKKTQVIFLTHHSHLVELAKESVDGGILHLQSL